MICAAKQPTQERRRQSAPVKNQPDAPHRAAEPPGREAPAARLARRVGIGCDDHLLEFLDHRPEGTRSDG